MRDVNVLFLSTGDRDTIISIFPFVDNSEDDSGEPASQQLLSLLVTNDTLDKVLADAAYGVDHIAALVIVAASFNIPGVMEEITNKVIEETKRGLELVRLSKEMHPELDHTRFWFFFTWAQDEEAIYGSASVH